MDYACLLKPYQKDENQNGTLKWELEYLNVIENYYTTFEETDKNGQKCVHPSRN